MVGKNKIQSSCCAITQGCSIRVGPAFTIRRRFNEFSRQNDRVVTLQRDIVVIWAAFRWVAHGRRLAQCYGLGLAAGQSVTVLNRIPKQDRREIWVVSSSRSWRFSVALNHWCLRPGLLGASNKLDSAGESSTTILKLELVLCRGPGPLGTGATGDHFRLLDTVVYTKATSKLTCKLPYSTATGIAVSYCYIKSKRLGRASSPWNLTAS